MMTVEELQQIMIEKGVVIRAIPMKIRGIYEKEKINKYPNGTIQYLPEFKREMLVCESVPQNAGKFIIEQNQGSLSTVKFCGKEYFDTIEDAVKSLV